jgi:NADP-dependent 3-hydroxy acid dehydrogenase YdfG
MREASEVTARDLGDAHTATPTLQGRKAIITGGTTGIGRAIAVLLASEGVDVFICGRDPQHLDDALERIRNVGKGDGCSIDLAEPDATERFAVNAQAYFGDFDIAIVNAAIPAQGLSDMSAADVRYAIAADFTAYVMTAHAAARIMKDKGDIVLIGSMSAHILGGGTTIYAGIKSGIAGFAEALRKELGPKGIKVALIEPGKTGADFQYEQFTAEEQAQQIRQDLMLRAEDIAVACHYALTQPRRAVVQQITIAPRNRDEE